MSSSQNPKPEPVGFDTLDRKSRDKLLADAESQTLEQLRGWVRENQERITYETGKLYRRVGVVLFLGGVAVFGVAGMGSLLLGDARSKLVELQSADDAVIRAKQVLSELETFASKIPEQRDRLERLDKRADHLKQQFDELSDKLELSRTELSAVVKASQGHEDFKATLSAMQKANDEAELLLQQIRNEKPPGKIPSKGSRKSNAPQSEP